MINQVRLQETLLDFLSYPSPQHDMNEVKKFISNVVKPRLQSAGFDRVTLDSAGNLLAERQGTDRSLAPLLWLTYGATYPAADMREPYPARVQQQGERTLVRGRGAAEQRSGLAAVVNMLSALAHQPPPVRGYCFVVCVAGEMGNHLVVDALVQEHGLQPAAAILAVATDNSICLGNLGRVDIKVEVLGRPCHSSNPANGINAVDGARKFLNAIDTLPPLPTDPELGLATLATTGISSDPHAPHTIPARCVVTLDRRLIPGETPDKVLQSLQNIATELAPYDVTVQGGHFNLPAKLEEKSSLAQLALAAAEAAGAPAQFSYRRAALDAGYFLSQGVPAIMWGPGDTSLAHTNDENVDFDDVVKLANAYLALTRRCCWDDPAALNW